MLPPPQSMRHAERVFLQIILENLGVIIFGSAIGWVHALVISVRTITKGVVDVPVFIGVPAILLSVATLACWIPARKVTRLIRWQRFGTSNRDVAPNV